MKGYSLPHIMYGEDRLTKPLVRQTTGKYKEVSWDSALDLIADKFAGFIQSDGVSKVGLEGKESCA